MAKKKNRNITPIKEMNELKDEIKFSQFIYKKYFIHLCNLIPNKDDEKLCIEFISNSRKNEKGIVYVFVIEDRILKIGQTITNINQRIQSYNCGKTRYRISGTNSTTNYFILQSLLSLDKIVKVYAYFTRKHKYKIFGEKGIDSFPSAKIIEKKIIKDFKEKYNKLPIANTQK